MLKYVLLFDDDCAACSRVAREVERLAVASLGVIALSDPLLTRALGDAGIELPRRAGLLVNDDSGLCALHGWSMRKHPEAVAGWRNARGFGERLRACRRAVLLSQQELAEQSGLSVRAIGNLERGRTLWPHPQSLHRLADALGLRDAARAEFIAAPGRRLAGATAIARPTGGAGRRTQSSDGRTILPDDRRAVLNRAAG
jgi:transcriptional regulator with XRE-family HTH domain